MAYPTRRALLVLTPEEADAQRRRGWPQPWARPDATPETLPAGYTKTYERDLPTLEQASGITPRPDWWTVVCPHEHVEPVESCVDGELLARLCLDCGDQLEAS